MKTVNIRKQTVETFRRFHYHIASLLLVGMVCVGGCEKSVTLEVSLNSLEFLPVGEGKTFDVESNTSWSVIKDADWLIIGENTGKGAGTVAVTAQPNISALERTATITVSGGDKTQTIRVKQKGATLSVSSSLSFSPEAGSFYLPIQSNTIWTAGSNETWLTISPERGSNDEVITITRAANTSPTEREAIITVSTGGITQTISATQEVANLTLSEHSMSFSHSGGYKAFDITSNVHWNISTDESWLRVTQAPGPYYGTVTVHAYENTTLLEREAIITVSWENITRTISVTQTGTPPTLTVSPTSLSFTPAGGERTLNITSNTDWEVSSDDEWLTVSTSSGSGNGKVTVNVAENTSTSRLTATITVSGGGFTRTISISQTGVSEILNVSPTSMSFSLSSDQKTITITSNTSWEVSSNAPSWLTVSPSSGMGDGTVTVAAADNSTSSSQRSATITVRGGSITRTISVTQEGAAAFLTVSPTSMSFSSSNEQKTFTITSNTSWVVSSNAPSWLTFSPSSGSGSETVTVTASANSASISQRTATITVRGGSITQTISVTQAGIYLTVSPISLSFSSSTEQKTFTITSNISWEVSSNAPSWITISPSSGTGDGTVTVAAADNSTSSSQRTATITVSGGSITRTISVTQAAGIYLTVSRSSDYFLSSGSTKNFTVTSNTNWTVSSDAVWLTISPSSGSDNGTVSYTAPVNFSTSDRTAVITVSGGDIRRIINITQYGAEENGSITFWNNNALGRYISVTLIGVGTKTITGYYIGTSPSCGAQYTATFADLPVGEYSYTATDGSKNWSGSVTRTTGCERILLN